MSPGLLELVRTWGSRLRSYIRRRLWRRLQNTIGVMVFYTICFVCIIRSWTRHLIWKIWPSKNLTVAKKAVAKKEKKETLVESIERRTGHVVAMEAFLTDDNLANCNPQSDSPLLQLPLELRNMVFIYVSAQFEDPNQPYSGTSYYYRPGHVAKLKTDTSLQFTCRRVWLEANALPMKLAEHTFWFERGPYRNANTSTNQNTNGNARHEYDRYDRFLKHLTTSNLQNLTYVHLFMQILHAEKFDSLQRVELFFGNRYLKLGLRLKTLHITIRQSDWGGWRKDDHPLILDERPWVQSILNAPQLGGTETFELELETIESKKEQLNSIVERLQKLEGNLTPVDPTDNSNLQQNRFVFVSPPQHWQWTRSPEFDGEGWLVVNDGKELQLHVATLVWKKRLSSTPRLQNSTRELSAGYTEQSSTIPLPVHSVAVVTPAMIMKKRARTALANKIQWDQTNDFPQYAADIQADSNEQAMKFEDKRKELFERLNREMEAKRMLQQWQADRSLLKFVQFPE